MSFAWRARHGRRARRCCGPRSGRGRGRALRGNRPSALAPTRGRPSERAQAHVALAAMTLILEDPALAAVGNLQVQVAAIGVAALTTNASYEGGRKLVPCAHHVPCALSLLRTMYPEDGRGAVRGAQEGKAKPLK